MALRGITAEMVEEAIHTPGWTDHGYSDKFLAFKQFPPDLLKVVYTVSGNDYVVVSTIWEEV